MVFSSAHQRVVQPLPTHLPLLGDILGIVLHREGNLSPSSRGEPLGLQNTSALGAYVAGCLCLLGLFLLPRW